MRIMRNRKAPAVPTFQLIATRNYHPVREGYIWNVYVVREADGTLAEYEVPAHRIGGQA
jgi:hypothetical protein